MITPDGIEPWFAVTLGSIATLAWLAIKIHDLRCGNPRND